MTETNHPPKVDLSDYVAKTGEEKRSIIKSIVNGRHGKTKDELDYDNVSSMVHDAFEHQKMNPYFSLIMQALSDSG